MKSRDEMVSSLLERRDRYVAEQKRKRTIITRTMTSMCCVFLVALLGVGLRQRGIIRTELPSNQAAESAVASGIKDTFVESKEETADISTANDKLVMNRISGISADRMKMNICLLADDFVEMTREEMLKYYGVNYIPDVPDDISPWENEKSGIYKRNGGIGEVYWDTDLLNYSNEDFTRNIHLEVDKGSNVMHDCFYFDGTEEKSVINNVEVFMGVTDNGYYYAEFMYKDVGFLIDANGVTQDEFVSVVSSLIQ